MSASVMQVFHQEMAAYYLRPSFEYQELASMFIVWISRLAKYVELGDWLLVLYKSNEFSFHSLKSENPHMEKGKGIHQEQKAEAKVPFQADRKVSEYFDRSKKGHNESSRNLL